MSQSTCSETHSIQVSQQAWKNLQKIATHMNITVDRLVDGLAQGDPDVTNMLNEMIADIKTIVQAGSRPQP